ncbi:MAG: hypothetical protein ACYC56_05435 [Candidatus Aquicultor sp.]
MKRVLAVMVWMLVIASAGLFAETLPMVRRLPKEPRVSLDGITTITDAVSACKQSGFEGWDLIGYAQNIVARKMRYSRLNPWDSPSRAFERGMGYCLQATLALKEIYDRLGIESRLVYADKCKFPGSKVDGMWQDEHFSTHAWLRISLDGTELDVDPASRRNTPGRVNFERHSDVRRLHIFKQPVIRLRGLVGNIKIDRELRASKSGL